MEKRRTKLNGCELFLSPNEKEVKRVTNGEEKNQIEWF